MNRSVQFEAFIVGLFGSTVGLLLGVLLAVGLKGLLGLFGADIPSNGLVFKPRTALVKSFGDYGDLWIYVLGPCLGALAALSPKRTRAPLSRSPGAAKMTS